MTFYHILSRGTDKRKIFLDDEDYLRGIHDLFEFNDIEPAGKHSDVRRPNVEKRARKLLVKIHAFCFMPNHYHLLLSTVVENGIPLFMKKFNGGYVKYFNEKYKRKGTLFEGRYKKVIVEDESHFIHLPYYIHLNPLDLITPEWREQKLSDFKKAMDFLDEYRWSSHLDYAGEKNFPSATQRDFLLNSFGDHKQYRDDIIGWLKELSIENIGGIMLE